MRWIERSLFCLVGFLSYLISLQAYSEPFVLTNAEIFTVDRENTWAEALAVDENGVIFAIGSEEEVLSETGDSIQIFDLKRRMVLPGFQDVHLHALEAGVNSELCEFDAFDTISGYKSSVKDCAAKGGNQGWVLGANVNMVNLLEQHENPIEILDEVSPDRPVLILDDIGHGAWINTLALNMADYNLDAGVSDGNIILRNNNGSPNGVVLENAPHRLRTLAFPPTVENLEVAYDSLLRAAKVLNANGITTVSDAGGYWPQGHDDVWTLAENEGVLTIRASNAFYIYPDKPFDQQMKTLKKLYHNDPNKLVRFNQAKIYIDGILSQATGAMLEPYEKGLDLQKGDEHGFLYFDENKLYHVAQTLAATGFQLHFHVTGDYGARLALNAIEKSDEEYGPHRLTHLYLVNQADYPRFAELNAVADLQLAPSTVDPEYEEFISGFIGARAKSLMPAGSLIKSGAIVTLSSDWDADELSPLVKIQTALERNNNGVADVRTAIRAMTINPAIALRHEDRTGSLEVGKLADLVILERNIMEVPTKEIGEVKVDATLLQGEVVFDRGDLFSN